MNQLSKTKQDMAWWGGRRIWRITKEKKLGGKSMDGIGLEEG